MFRSERKQITRSKISLIKLSYLGPEALLYYNSKGASMLRTKHLFPLNSVFMGITAQWLILPQRKSVFHGVHSAQCWGVEVRVLLFFEKHPSLSL